MFKSHDVIELNVTNLINGFYNSRLTLCIPEPHNGVLLKTVKTQMKCSIMLHFIWVYTVCKGKKDLQTKEYNIF